MRSFSLLTHETGVAGGGRGPWGSVRSSVDVIDLAPAAVMCPSGVADLERRRARLTPSSSGVPHGTSWGEDVTSKPHSKSWTARSQDRKTMFPTDLLRSFQILSSTPGPQDRKTARPCFLQIPIG